MGDSNDLALVEVWYCSSHVVTVYIDQGSSDRTLVFDIHCQHSVETRACESKRRTASSLSDLISCVTV